MVTLPSSIQRHPRAWGFAGIVLLLVLVAVLLLVALRSVSAVAIAVFDIDQSAGPDPGVNVREVATHGSAMYGKTVTITAEVREIYNPDAMKVGGSNPIYGTLVLLVSEQPWDALVGEPIEAGDDVVRVTGVVQPFDVPALERQFGVDLDDNLASEYDGSSVMIVQEITLDPPLAFGPGDKEFPFESDGWEVGVSISELVDEPREYIGETLKVSGEIEEGVLTPHAFLLGDDKLLVISPEPRDDLFVEPTAYVTGEVRIFDLRAIEQEFGIDLDDDQLVPHNGRPVIIAEQIELVK